MALIPCPSCGKNISDRAAACPNCGAPVVKEPPEESVNNFCAECGAELQPDVCFCPNCGCPVESPKEEIVLIRCVECGVGLPPEADSCPNCGCPVEKPEEMKSEIPVRRAPAKPAEEQPKKKKSLIAVICAAAAVLVLGAIFLLTRGPSKEEISAGIQAMIDSGDYVSAMAELQKNENLPDYDTLKTTIRDETVVMKCVEELKKLMFNPSSLQIREINFFESTGEYPIVILSTSGQNKLGGYASSYTMFSGTDLTPVCDVHSLDKDDISSDDMLSWTMITTFLDGDSGIDNVANINRINRFISESTPVNIDISQIAAPGAYNLSAAEETPTSN